MNDNTVDITEYICKELGLSEVKECITDFTIEYMYNKVFKPLEFEETDPQTNIKTMKIKFHRNYEFEGRLGMIGLLNFRRPQLPNSDLPEDSVLRGFYPMAETNYGSISKEYHFDTYINSEYYKFIRNWIEQHLHQSNRSFYNVLNGKVERVTSVKSKTKHWYPSNEDIDTMGRLQLNIIQCEICKKSSKSLKNCNKNCIKEWSTCIKRENIPSIDLITHVKNLESKQNLYGYEYRVALKTEKEKKLNSENEMETWQASCELEQKKTGVKHNKKNDLLSNMTNAEGIISPSNIKLRSKDQCMRYTFGAWYIDIAHVTIYAGILPSKFKKHSDVTEGDDEKRIQQQGEFEFELNTQSLFRNTDERSVSLTKEQCIRLIIELLMELSLFNYLLTGGGEGAAPLPTGGAAPLPTR